jgi:hypothetical protein
MITGTKHRRSEMNEDEEKHITGEPGILFINAYLVTRHYGGPEEGGWWYNAGQAVTSIPCAAHWQPDAHFVGEFELVPDAPVDWTVDIIRTLFSGLEHGDIYSVAGGSVLQIQIEESFARDFPVETPHYE